MTQLAPALDLTVSQTRFGFVRAIAPLAGVIAVAMVMHLIVGPLAGAYPRRIMLDTGIAIILAVSLNIVNGYTRQFSIGHAAFMAIGGYVGGFVTYYASLKLFGDYVPRPGIGGPHEWMLLG